MRNRKLEETASTSDKTLTLGSLHLEYYEAKFNESVFDETCLLFISSSSSQLEDLLK